MRVLTALPVLLLVSPAMAGQITITVGPGGQYHTLAQAVAKANSDQDLSNYYVIDLAPRVYLNDFADTITRPMTIQSSSRTQRAILKSTVPLPNEKGILLTVSSLTIRGLEITGAFIDNSLGGNGAALRDQNPEGTTATVVVDNVFIHDNQAGILQGDDSAEVITVTQSQFKNNGNPNSCCFTHGIYIDEATSLNVMHSFFCGQLIGHEIKSRAAQTMVVASQVYSGEGAPSNSGCRVGNASFDVQFANGGVGTLSGNTLFQGPSAQNHKIVSYGAEGVIFTTNSLTVLNNSFISTAGSIAISDPPCIAVDIGTGNTFSGISEIVDPPGCLAQ